MASAVVLGWHKVAIRRPMVRADRQEIPLRVLPGHRVGKEPIDLDLLELAVRVLVEAAHPDIADAVTVYGWLLPLVCQDELYNPGQDVPINPTSNSMLTHQRPFPDVRLGHTPSKYPPAKPGALACEPLKAA